MESYFSTGAVSIRSSVFPCGTPSTMSTTMTSASSLRAIPWATVAPTLPPPTTVTFVFISTSWVRYFRAGSYRARRILQDRERHRRDDEKVGEGAAAGGLPGDARRPLAGGVGCLLLRLSVSAQRPAHGRRRRRGADRGAGRGDGANAGGNLGGLV